MKKLFTKNIAKTEEMRSWFMSMATEGYEYIGVFNYKDYIIFVDKIPEKNGQILKHISISRDKKLDERDIKVIAEHFIGEKYQILGNILPVYVVNVWEVKDV